MWTSESPTAVVPFITAEPPLEVSRNKNPAAFDYYRMVPSVPFYKGETIPYLGDTEEIVENNFMTTDIIIPGNESGKIIFGFLLGAFLVYLLTARNRR